MKRVIKRMKVKPILAVIAVVIVVASLLASHLLVRDLAIEERSKMELFANALHLLDSDEEQGANISLILTILKSNQTIPVIAAKPNGEILMHRNVVIQGTDSIGFLTKQLLAFKSKNEPIEIWGDNIITPLQIIYYDDSLILKRLIYFPFIQVGAMLAFLIMALYTLLITKRSEQNKVWVGLSRETAHQLGTPISSMMAWTELLAEKYEDDVLLLEMKKDVNRLQTIADRFSKIGSKYELQSADMKLVITQIVDYMRARTSAKVKYTVHVSEEPILAQINITLFEWVIENLCKNAIDSMAGVGSIDLYLTKGSQKVIIDVVDSGKGIPKSKFKTIFTPGYTTKARGWGLGLSLAKRVVEEYHKGSIAVHRSELNVGTTFRIELKG